MNGHYPLAGNCLKATEPGLCPSPAYFFKHLSNLVSSGNTSVNFCPVNFHDKSYIIFGAGFFGTRALKMISNKFSPSISIVDLNERRLSVLNEYPVKKILSDAIDFLIENFKNLNPSCIIVPAIPVHLAAEFIKKYFAVSVAINKILIPESIKKFVPYCWEGNEDSLLVSYADFLCPENCMEQEFCSVTKKRREQPLYTLLNNLDVSDTRVEIIKSVQILPGVGGFELGELIRVLDIINASDAEKWLIGTSCKCHGILTAFELVS